MTDKHQPNKPLSRAASTWLEENKDAIDAFNERVAKHGMLIKPIWLRNSDDPKPPE